MDDPVVYIFLVVVLFGSYFQSVTGFAMGIIIVSILGGLRVLEIPALAAVISLLAMINVLFALKGRYRLIDRSLFFWLGLGQVPAIFLGLMFMNWLDLNSKWMLEACLGLFITLGSLSMVLRPEPNKQRSRPSTVWFFGSLGGLVGGMFSASGPVLGWFAYRQPIELAIIRSTLLSCFMLTTTTRSVLVGLEGGLDQDVMTLVVVGLPAVILGAWLGRRLPPALSENVLKRSAFGLLFILGLGIIVTSISQAFN